MEGCITKESPQCIMCYILQFELFYVQKYTGRKLAWLHHMSIGE